jgi:hypothetical protein
MLNWGNVTGDGKNLLMDARRALSTQPETD